MQLQVPTYIHSRGRRKKYTFHSRFYYVGFLFLVKRSISVENRPRSGRFGSRSVEVGQVEKNRPTPNTIISISETIFGRNSLDRLIIPCASGRQDDQDEINTESVDEGKSVNSELYFSIHLCIN